MLFPLSPRRAAGSMARIVLAALLLAPVITFASLGADAVAGPTVEAAPAAGTIATFAGTRGDGGPALSADLASIDLAVDGAGNVYVAESQAIRRIAAGTHVVTTIAGNGHIESSGDGGPAIDAGVTPYGMAVASNGDLYFGEYAFHRVRRISAATGIVTTVVGTGVSGTAGNGGPATAAQLVQPTGLAFGSDGALYIADYGDHRIRKVSNGIISIVAGTGVSGFDFDNQPATNGKLNGPRSVTLDSADNLYIADAGNHRLRKVSASTGLISTVAGTGTAGFNGDGIGTSTQITSPLSVSYAAGAISFTDYENHRVRKLTLATGSLFTVAGTGVQGQTGNGGAATLARLAYPSGLVVFGGSTFVTDNQYHVRVISAGLIDAFGGVGLPFAGDGGPAAAAVMSTYLGVAVGTGGDVVIADGGNARLRKVSGATGVISTIAGSGFPGFNGDGPASTVDMSPSSPVLDVAGNVYFADVGTNRVRRLNTANGTITTLIGTGVSAYNGDGPGTTVNIDPSGLTIDAAGNLYVADWTNARVRKWTAATGAVTTIAGTGAGTFNGDGPVATTNVRADDVAIAANGDLYLSEYDFSRIRVLIAATGRITTIAGTGSATPNGDHLGVDTDVRPTGLALSPQGELFFTEGDHFLVRRWSPVSRAVDTIAGTGVSGFSGDGGPAIGARLSSPGDLAIGASGELYVADGANHRVRTVTPVPAPAAVQVGPAFVPVVPERLLDTRSGLGAAKGRLTAGSTLTLQVSGVGVAAVPVSASAVVLNVTVTDPAVDGFVTVWPCGSAQPLASNVNFVAGQTVPNAVIVKLGVGGTVCMAGQSTTHLIADIGGWFAAGPAFVPVVPERLLDTRSGLGAPKGRLVAGSALTLQVVGVGVAAVPSSASAVVLNVTVTDPAVDGFVTVWPCGQPQPLASNVNFVAGQTVPNAVIVKLGVGGTVCMAGQSTTHLIADIGGWFAAGPAFAPVVPERLLDTRSGVGAVKGRLAAGSTLTLQVVGVGVAAVPSSASAVVLNVTVTDPAVDGFVTVWPCGQPQPLASNVNFVAGQTVPNAVIVKLGVGGTVCMAGQSTTHLIADIGGWFSG